MRSRNLVPRMAGLLLVAAHALATPVLVPIPGIVSTGVGLTQGATDVNYLLISAPAGVSVVNPVVICSTVGCEGGTVPAFPFANSPIVWIANDVNSQWVGVNAVQYGDRSPTGGPGTGITVGDPAGDYIFQVSFLVPDSLALSTAHISGAWSVDNTGGIYLNGDAVSSCTGLLCFQTMQSFDITSNFVLGVNHLDFRVNNVSQGFGNPQGLRVEMAGTYETIPEPGTAALWVAGLAMLAILRRRKAS